MRINMYQGSICSPATCERYGTTLNPTTCKHVMEHAYYDYVDTQLETEPPTELMVKRANSKRVMERQAKQARSKRFVPSF